jgi:hypothetical protein
VRLLVIAEQMLDGRAGCGQASARRGRLRRDEREAFNQRFVAVGELSGGGQRLGGWVEQRDAILRGRCGGQQPRSAGDRARSLEAGMSRYLVDRVTAHPKITVLTGTRVIAAGGQPSLESVTVVDRDGPQRELRADAMYVLIGGQPLTAGVEGWLRRDDGGYLMTGPDLHRDRHTEWWPLARDPLPLESSQPGLFVAGDVRHGSIKRVASAVGEGAMAIALLHAYLAEQMDGP